MFTYVTADDWGVSYTSGTDIDGVLLNVYRFPDGVYKPPVYAEKARPFATRDEAKEYAYKMGFLKLYVPVKHSQDELDEAFGHLKI